MLEMHSDSDEEEGGFCASSSHGGFSESDVGTPMRASRKPHSPDAAQGRNSRSPSGSPPLPGHGFVSSDEEAEGQLDAEAEVLPIALRPELELRCLGAGITREVSEVLLQAPRTAYAWDYAKERRSWLKILNTAFSQAPRVVMPITAESKRLKMRQTDVYTKLHALAMCIHCVIQIYWASTLSWARNMMDRKQVEGIAYVTRWMQDETPARIAVSLAKDSGQPSTSQLALAPAAEADVWTRVLQVVSDTPFARHRFSTARRKPTEQQVAKVLQMDIIEAFLLKLPKTKDYTLVTCELPVRVVVWDTVTGESLYVSVKETVPLPLKEDMQERMKMCAILTHWDRGAPCGRLTKILLAVELGKLLLDNGLCATHS